MYIVLKWAIITGQKSKFLPVTTKFKPTDFD